MYTVHVPSRKWNLQTLCWRLQGFLIFWLLIISNRLLSKGIQLVSLSGINQHQSKENVRITWRKELLSELTIKISTTLLLPFQNFHHGSDLSDSISCFSAAFLEPWGRRGIFAGLAGYSRVFTVISRRRAFMLFPPHSPAVGSRHFVLLVTDLYLTHVTFVPWVAAWLPYVPMLFSRDLHTSNYWNMQFLLESGSRYFGSHGLSTQKAQNQASSKGRQLDFFIKECRQEIIVK